MTHFWVAGHVYLSIPSRIHANFESNTNKSQPNRNHNNNNRKSTLLKIMAGVEKEYDGLARPLPGASIGYLPQVRPWYRLWDFVKNNCLSYYALYKE